MMKKAFFSIIIIIHVYPFLNQPTYLRPFYTPFPVNIECFFDKPKSSHPHQLFWVGIHISVTYDTTISHYWNQSQKQMHLENYKFTCFKTEF